jgi:hypothetical protein
LPDLGYFAGLALHSETAPNEEVANKTRTAFTQGKYAVYSFRIQDNSATIPGNQSYLVWCPKWFPFSNDPQTIEAVCNRTRQRLGGQTIWCRNSLEMSPFGLNRNVPLSGVLLATGATAFAKANV